ncbi:TM2 domain-containing protein 1 isoform X2 [Bos taurus]|uniref:TM2 domain-containing protein 1 isoform X2 n=1 Tax=Bos taurus TaxID=9913 RepID=UPI000572B11B|nr:TM2 domain-containing protein 1 isoform X2 [Bos taurus]
MRFSSQEYWSELLFCPPGNLPNPGIEPALAVQCFPAPNITCKDFGGNETHFTGNEVGFLKPISCRNVNGYSYKVAVALSLFLGWLGADRFYLGYPALGLLKFCTVGFCGIGSLIDFILISMQKLKSSKLQPKKKTGMSGSALGNPGVGLVLDKTKSIQSNVLTTPLLFISASLC